MGGEWPRILCGVGPVEAAAATAAAIARHSPGLILHVGIAGARRQAGLPPPALVIGTESRYCDLAVPEDWAPRVVLPSRPLLYAAARALPHAVQCAIGTSARVGQHPCRGVEQRPRRRHHPRCPVFGHRQVAVPRLGANHQGRWRQACLTTSAGDADVQDQAGTVPRNRRRRRRSGLHGPDAAQDPGPPTTLGKLPLGRRDDQHPVDRSAGAYLPPLSRFRPSAQANSRS